MMIQIGSNFQGFPRYSMQMIIGKQIPHYSFLLSIIISLFHGIAVVHDLESELVFVRPKLCLTF